MAKRDAGHSGYAEADTLAAAPLDDDRIPFVQAAVDDELGDRLLDVIGQRAFE